MWRGGEWWMGGERGTWVRFFFDHGIRGRHGSFDGIHHGVTEGTELWLWMFNHGYHRWAQMTGGRNLEQEEAEGELGAGSSAKR